MRGKEVGLDKMIFGAVTHPVAVLLLIAAMLAWEPSRHVFLSIVTMLAEGWSHYQ